MAITNDERKGQDMTKRIGAHDGQGDYRCNDCIDSIRFQMPVYEGQDFDCTYCGRDYMTCAWCGQQDETMVGEGENRHSWGKCRELTEADVEYIGERPHPHSAMPGTMGRLMLGRQRRFKEVAERCGMTVPEVQRAYIRTLQEMRR